MKKSIWILAIAAIFLLVSTSAYATPGDKLIKHGMRGEDVQYVQKFLAEAGFYAGPIDGIFGNGTLGAVKAFQQSAGLPADGIIGKDTVKFLERANVAPNRYTRSLTMRATAYTIHDEGNGTHTYRGNLLRKGLVAVDPSVIPLGSRLYIEGYGYAIADDIGGAIKGSKIDLAYESRSDALRFGVQNVTVYVLD